ncbi:GntR family transcriptional regulator [Saccharospirillum mangrovi]|uniref:GntR family transcriptional regulator n=1 Tax=Saccharospirillum mangrovi TaxID=2161747 RepID=UPI000D3643D2|nr:GntR family transcriptional regulator [Saccharospirillum mangrovi]
MTKSANIHKLDAICNDVRKRICIGEFQGGEVLFEEKLAKEFEVSRTPIRQVLHRLALERFVETKSGVGTLIIPADRTNFRDDLTVLVDILKITAELGPLPLDDDDRLELAALSQLSKMLVKQFSVGTFWTVCYRYNDLIRHKIRHDLLSDTFHILFCRVYRSLLLNQQENGATLAKNLMQELQAALLQSEQGDDAAPLFRLRLEQLSALSAP